MNSLVLHRIEKFSKKYQNRTFDQDDVMLLLSDLRDTTEKNSLARELGDFIAHPHGRSQGVTWQIFEQVYLSIMDDFDDIFLGNIQVELKPLSNEIEILESVSNAITDLGIDSGCMKSPINDRRAMDFMLCVVGLLSSFKIEVNGVSHPLHISLG